MKEQRGGGTVNERLKELRKELKLTQQEFANKIGISRGNIGAYEVGKNKISDAVISLICTKFHVNEDWLRTGNGDMFIEMTKDEQIEEFIGDALRNEEDSFKKRLISGLAALDENGLKGRENFLGSIQKKERD